VLINYDWNVQYCWLLLLELDVRCEACQRFFKEGLMTSFVKILTDEAVSGWKMEIHVSLTVVYGKILISSLISIFGRTVLMGCV